jgi:peptide/nickel transport system substrate-binding protein
VEWAAFIKEFVDKGRFDAVILGWNILQDPDIYDVWHSSKAVAGGLNFVHYRNAELDDLLEKGRRTLDQGRRTAIYRRVQEILHEDQPYCFLYIPMSLPILQARIQGVEPAPAGIDHNFYQWWIPREFQRPVLQQ